MSAWHHSYNCTCCQHEIRLTEIIITTSNRTSTWIAQNSTTMPIFMRESSYSFQRILAIAIMSVRPSICLFVTRLDQSKTVQIRISKSSPSAA